MNTMLKTAKQGGWALCFGLFLASVLCAMLRGATLRGSQAEQFLSIAGFCLHCVFSAVTVCLACSCFRGSPHARKSKRNVVLAIIGLMVIAANFMIWGTGGSSHVPIDSAVRAYGKHAQPHLRLDKQTATPTEHLCVKCDDDRQESATSALLLGNNSTANFIASTERAIDDACERFMQTCEWDFLSVLDQFQYSDNRSGSLLFGTQYRDETADFIEKMRLGIEASVECMANGEKTSPSANFPRYDFRMGWGKDPAPISDFGETNSPAGKRMLRRLSAIQTMTDEQIRLYKEQRGNRLALLRMCCKEMFYAAYLKRLPGQNILEAFNMGPEMVRWSQAFDKLRKELRKTEGGLFKQLGVED